MNASVKTDQLKPSKAAPVAPLDGSATIQSLCDAVADDVDGILCATSIMRDLLRLAIQEVERVPGSRADSALRAAERYVGDIEKIAEHLNAIELAALEGAAA
jgi:hypothetical protein